MNYVTVQTAPSDDTTVWTLSVSVSGSSYSVPFKSGTGASQTYLCDSITFSRPGHSDFTVTPDSRSLVTLCNSPFTANLGPSDAFYVIAALSFFGFAYFFTRLFKV